MIQIIPYYEIKFDKTIELEDKLKTEVDSDFGYIFEVDLIYSDEIKEKTRHFPFCLEIKVSPQDNFSD